MPRVSHRTGWVIFPIVTWVVAILIAMQSVRADAQNPDAPAPQFDRTGAHVGEQLPNLPLYGLDGKPGRFREALRYDGALLITASLTSPQSRATCAQAEELATKLDGKLPVVILYVQEANPQGDDLTAENRREGILFSQPKTLQERLKLANEFKDRLHVKSPIRVDGMDNAVSSALGGGPNMGVLVDGNGIVIARQNWFDAPSMRQIIDGFLKTVYARKELERQRPDDQALESRVEEAGFGKHVILETFSHGDVNAASKLLDLFPGLVRYATAESVGICRETLLDMAVDGGSLPMIELLLSRGADINAQTSDRASALHLAAKLGRVRIVELLLKHGADVNFRAREGPTALQEAAIYENPAVVEILLKAGAKPNSFSDAAMGNVDAVRHALDADPTCGVRPDGWDRTLLDYAASNGQLEVMKLLFSRGIRDDESVANGSEPAIHWAAKHKQIAAITFLLKNGDDPNAQGLWGDTLLHDAADDNDPGLALLVLPYRPDLQVRCSSGETPLHEAVRYHSRAVGELLLAAGADPNVGCGCDGRPNGLFSDVPSLQTPLQLAAERSDVEMLQMMLAHSAAVNARDNRGQTALHYAVTETDENKAQAVIEVIRLLIAGGADVNAKDNDGHTPLDLCRQDAFSAYLEAYGAKRGSAEGN